ncbi:MAG: Crp/Fnr family transcriptional regulator [Elusimicrobia bacterium]|nr:Crp/Fnr family transcriptional regulator [Elusimicrobiota bacterium]
MVESESPQIARLLSEMPLFQGLPAEQRESLARNLQVRRFRSQEIVYCEKDPAESSWVVLSGRARILSYICGARLMQMEALERGQVFGLLCRLGADKQRYPCTAIADGPLCALRLPDAVFDRLYERYDSVSREACRLCAKRLGSFRRLVPFEREGVLFRVAEILLSLYRKHGARIPATRHGIAEQTGAALETVFRALAHFRRRGWLETERGVIRLKAPQALSQYLRQRERG